MSDLVAEPNKLTEGLAAVAPGEISVVEGVLDTRVVRHIGRKILSPDFEWNSVPSDLIGHQAMEAFPNTGTQLPAFLEEAAQELEQYMPFQGARSVARTRLYPPGGESTIHSDATDDFRILVPWLSVSFLTHYVRYTNKIQGRYRASAIRGDIASINNDIAQLARTRRVSNERALKPDHAGSGISGRPRGIFIVGQERTR